MPPSDQSRDLSRLRIARKDQSIESTAPSRVRLFGYVLLTLCFFAVVMWLTRPEREKKGPNATPTPSRNQAPALVVAATESGILNATGYVVAQRKAAVSSKATGRLKTLNVVEGDVVRSGDILAELEDDDLQALVREQAASLMASQAQLAAAEAELADAELHLGRTKQLSVGNVVSKADLDIAGARFKKAKASVDLARADVTVSEARLEKVKVDLEYTLIRAPFDGTVLTKNADVGEIVAPFGSSADARAAVVTLADMSSLQVEADISEANLEKVFVGQRCSITLDSFPGHTYEGVVDKIVPTVDRAKATVLAKIRFTDKDARVIPEMSAKVSFRAKDHDATP